MPCRATTFWGSSRFTRRPSPGFARPSSSAASRATPLDTNQILEILTKHLDWLKPLRPDTETTRLPARLVEDRRKTVELRASHLQALKASLKEYFPQTLEILGHNVTSRQADDFLKKWPTFAEFEQAKPSTVQRFFHGHNVRSPALIEKVQQVARKSQSLTADPAIGESGVRLSQMHAEVIRTLNPLIEQYDRKIETVFHDHPEARLFTGVPGTGPALSPRLLVAFGTDRSRYEAAGNLQSFSGVGPVTRSSGKTRVVCARCACPKFLRQTFHEFARLSVAQCQWAQNHADYHTGQGKMSHTVIRALAFKWIRILFRCRKDRAPYDEQKHMKRLAQRGSIFATLHLQKDS